VGFWEVKRKQQKFGGGGIPLEKRKRCFGSNFDIRGRGGDQPESSKKIDSEESHWKIKMNVLSRCLQETSSKNP